MEDPVIGHQSTAVPVFRGSHMLDDCEEDDCVLESDYGRSIFADGSFLERRFSVDCHGEERFGSGEGIWQSRYSVKFLKLGRSLAK